MFWLRILLSLLIAITGGLTVGPSTARAATPSPPPAQHDITHPRIMQEASQSEAIAPRHPYKPIGGPAPKQAYGTAGRLNREVFGFAYGSSLGDPTIGYPSWDFSLLSTVAYFGIHVGYDGGFIGDSSWSTWDDPNGPVPGMISLAHANGVKMVLTIILQDFDSQHGTPMMCSGLVNYQRTITQIMNQVRAKPIDGINLDYEGLNGNCYDTGTNQIESLQWMLLRLVRALRQQLPSGSYLSIDTYSGSAGDRSGTTYYGFFDITALSQYVDSFFVMTYDMEYSNFDLPPTNCASFCLGPTSPLTTYYYNDTRAIADYKEVVPATKVILGIPYYGRKECVVSGSPSDAPPNAYPISGTVAADGYGDASTENGYYLNSDYHAHRDANVGAGGARWDTWHSIPLNCTRELYWDDVTSLGAKYDLVNATGARGIGIWTLSYGGGAPELWNLIANRFAACQAVYLSVSPASPGAVGSPVDFSAQAAGCTSPQYKFWVAPPGGAWTVGRDYASSSTWTWNPTGVVTGTYHFQVWARQAASPNGWDTWNAASYSLYGCGSVGATPSEASPGNLGDTIVFAAAASGCASPQFKLWMSPAGGTWTVVQDWTASSSLSWNTSGLAPGSYWVQVWARAAASSNVWDTWTSLPYALRIPTCTSARAAASPPSAQTRGLGVTFTAGSTGCPSPQYKFWIASPGGAWTVAQDWSSSARFAWNPSSFVPGTYWIQAWARQAGSTAAYEAWTSIPYTLSPCAAIAASASPSSPQGVGAAVTLSVDVNACPWSTYKFWVAPPGGAWAMAQDWSTASSLAWNTTGLASGTYHFQVWGRLPGSTATYDAWVSFSYTLLASCMSVTAAASPASPQAHGTAVTLSAAAAGCSSPQYKFWVQAPSGAWSVAQDWSASSSLTWSTGSLAAGTYAIQVWARQSGSTATYEAWTGFYYQLT